MAIHTSLVDMFTLIILGISGLWGFLFGGRRQLMNLLLMYAAIIFAFQHCATVANILNLISPNIDYLALEGFAAFVVGLWSYIFLLAFSLWIYGFPTPLPSCAASVGERMIGLIIGLLQGWVVVVLLGIAFAPVLDYLLMSAPNEWRYLVSGVKATSTWHAISYSADILIPIVRPWLPGPSCGLLKGWK